MSDAREKTNPGSPMRAARVVPFEERERKRREAEDRERLMHTLTVVGKILGIVAIALAYAVAIINRAEELPRRIEVRLDSAESEFRSGLQRLEVKVDQNAAISSLQNRDTQLDVRALSQQMMTREQPARLAAPPPEIRPVAEVKP